MRGLQLIILPRFPSFPGSPAACLSNAAKLEACEFQWVFCAAGASFGIRGREIMLVLWLIGLLASDLAVSVGGMCYCQLGRTSHCVRLHS